ncbi:MAG: GerW family sporulation protein [Erysipelotrichales bacterium]|nr:GerW family sporulation protein [Erysipelotrichales bacterium]
MEHQINNLMRVSLENLKDMIDVNTIVGEPIKGIEDGTLIIPISRVKLAFASGGTDFGREKEIPNFGGGTGGSVSLHPIAFIVIKENEVKIMHVEDRAHLAEKLIDKMPEAIDQIKSFINNFRKESI